MPAFWAIAAWMSSIRSPRGGTSTQRVTLNEPRVEQRASLIRTHYAPTEAEGHEIAQEDAHTAANRHFVLWTCQELAHVELAISMPGCLNRNGTVDWVTMKCLAPIFRHRRTKMALSDTLKNSRRSDPRLLPKLIASLTNSMSLHLISFSGGQIRSVQALKAYLQRTMATIQEPEAAGPTWLEPLREMYVCLDQFDQISHLMSL